MSPADERTLLARSDLADAALEGRVRARRFARPEPLVTRAPSAPLRRSPAEDSERMDELVFGEAFGALERSGEFLWGQARRDGYVGYVRADALGAAAAAPTHRVAAIRSFAFAEPSIKSAALGPFSLNALVAIESGDGDLARAAGGGWFWRAHLAPIESCERDLAAVAEQFLGAPYLWGGRTSVGLDCSGLVQQALYACGRACPRDTDQQATLGREADPDALERGDLVFWRGHVGIMLDAERLIHANGHHMAVAIEPLAEAVARIARGEAGGPTAFRRL